MGVIKIISIVIPTYNQRKRLSVTLQALSKQHIIQDVSVIVINDGSTDDTKEFLDNLDFHWLTVVHQENMGRSMARNNGVRLVRSKYVLFLDDDMVVTSDFIRQHLNVQLHQEGIYIGDIFNIPFHRVDLFIKNYNQEADIQELIELQQEDLLVNLARYFYQYNDGKLNVSWVCMVAANVSIPLQLFKQVSGFDQEFKKWGVEDHELAFRCHQEGSKFFFLKKAKAFHLDHQKEINRTQLLENVLYFYKKNSPNKEVKAYVDFVTSKISMTKLYEIVIGFSPVRVYEEVFFKPNSHLSNKEGL